MIKNRFIPTMTGSLTSLVVQKRGTEYVPLIGTLGLDSASQESYRNFLQKSVSDFHYDETVSKLSPDMPAFGEIKHRFAGNGIAKRFIGYAVVNYDDRLLFPDSNELPEHFYLHRKGSARRREDRLLFKDGSTLIASGHVFDIRQPAVRSALCDRIVKCMRENGVDGVLIDYAVRRYGFGAPGMLAEMPEGWFEEFQNHQFELITELYTKLDEAGLLLFLNGIMLDSIVVTEPAFINIYLKHCHGMFWEQPFRWEWRDYFDGSQDYYQRLEQFFAIVLARKKLLVVKCGTYRFHATEEIEPTWTARYEMTDSGIERHLASYCTCFFLLFYTRFWHVLYYTHPTELFDIFSSEPFFRIWDIEIGDPVGGRIEYCKHVQLREFENAIVFVNNTLKPIAISCNRALVGLVHPLPNLKLAPLSGYVWIKPRASRRFFVARVRRRVADVLRGRQKSV